ncbi:MAG: hypothetical protein NTU44_14020, partial [Bacteroidetes bacterium]|nr:hypothetical protein [Bacteroidota bacterium]
KRKKIKKKKYRKYAKTIHFIGLVAMILGIIDPLEGSIVILVGSLLTVVASWLAGSPYFKIIFWSFILIVIGVSALFGVSAAGGIGGNTGRPMWLMVVFFPYPLGWIIGITYSVKQLRLKPLEENSDNVE